MRGSTKLFRIFGIDVKLHFSWWFIFALLSWSLSSAFFPHFYPDLGIRQYWIMGVSSALLLFFSVLLHELSHSLVAKSKNIKVESITLFFFGGVAGITDEEMKPWDELQMALAGPIFSLTLAGIFFLIFKYNGNILFSGIMFYLYQLNLILAVFNLVPGYPLDGGRALRAILHAYYKDLKKATRIASQGGKFFAGFLIFLGIFGIITGVVNGLWFILLGGFLWFIAGMSYEQVVIKGGLAKVPLREVLDKKYLSLNPDLSFAEAVKKAYPYRQDSFLVKKGTELAGILDFKRIAKMPSEMQKRIKVKQLMIPRSSLKMISSQDSCYQAFKLMLEQNLDLLPVMSGFKVIGVISKKTLTHRLIWDLKYGPTGSGKISGRRSDREQKS